MPVKFVQFDRETPLLFPPSVQDYLPKNHLARFVVEVVEQLDLKRLTGTYAGYGSKPYHPEVLVALLFYGYATGVFSSRKLAQATYDSVAFRFICANTNPDHRTISDFRKRFLPELEALFVEILLIAQEAGLIKLGTVSLDGTKIKANASKHKALSWEYANRLEEQIKQEVTELMRLAEQSDTQELPELDIPHELERREKRLEVIATAKEEIRTRAKERFKHEQAEYERKQAERKAYEEKTGKKTGGKAPEAPTPEPKAKDQVNLTDSESRIMPTSGGGFEQAYNAQASVDIDTHLIVEQHVTQHTNDKKEVAPAIEKLSALPEQLGNVDHMLTDAGFYSEKNIEQCLSAGIEPLMPPKRQSHNLSLAERLANASDPPENPTPTEAVAHRLRTPEGKALYAKRKATVETVFGVIKHALGFRQFLLRGFRAVQSEWTLVCIGWNLKRFHTMSAWKTA